MKRMITCILVILVMLSTCASYASSQTFGGFSIDIPSSFREGFERTLSAYTSKSYDGFPNTGDLTIYVLPSRPTLDLALAEAQSVISVYMDQKPTISTKEINDYSYSEIVYAPKTFSQYCSIAVFSTSEAVYAIRLDGAYYKTDEFSRIWDKLIESISFTGVEIYGNDLPEAYQNYVVLKKGSKGDDVAALQQRLIELSYLDDTADGVFGGKTKTAIEVFQKTIGLPVTGIADEMTQGMLFSEDAPKRTLSISSSTTSLGGYSTTVWYVDGQTFTLSGSKTKKLKLWAGTYVFYADGSYDKLDD